MNTFQRKNKLKNHLLEAHDIADFPETSTGEICVKESKNPTKQNQHLDANV